MTGTAASLLRPFLWHLLVVQVPESTMVVDGQALQVTLSSDPLSISKGSL